MDIDPILEPLDCKEDAYSKYLDKFRGQPNFNILMDCIILMIQEISDNIYFFNNNRWLDNATGFLLDYIGIRVGEDRKGLDDETYRERIRIRIRLNSSGGETDAIITAVQIITDAFIVIAKDAPPASFFLHIGSDKVDKNIKDLLQPLVAAGVEIQSITHSSLPKPFKFGTVYAEPSNVTATILKDGKLETSPIIDGSGRNIVTAGYEVRDGTPFGTVYPKTKNVINDGGDNVKNDADFQVVVNIPVDEEFYIVGGAGFASVIS